MGGRSIPKDFIPWHCRLGHVDHFHPGTKQAWCGKCTRSGIKATEMKPKDLFPHWNKSYLGT